MDSYKIEVLSSADHDARKIDRKNLKRILESVHSLKENPFPAGFRKLKYAESGYRIRMGDYRVLYDVDTQNKIVSIFHIRHRKEAYRI